MNTIILLIAAFISGLESQSQQEIDIDAICISEMSQDLISQIRTDIDDIFNECYLENEFNQLMTSTPAATLDLDELNISTSQGDDNNDSDKPTLAPIPGDNEFVQSLTPTASTEDNNPIFNAPTLAPIPEDIINAVIETINERGIDINETLDGNIGNIIVVLGSNEEDDAVCLSQMSQDILSSVKTDLDDILNDCYEQNEFNNQSVILTPTPTIARLNTGDDNDDFNAPTLPPIPEDIITAITEIINDRGIDTNQTNDTTDGDIGVFGTNAPNNKRCSKSDEYCEDDNDCCGSLQCGDRLFCIINRS